MKKEEMHVVADLNTRRRALGYTNEYLAEKIGKDPSTVQRQLSQMRGQCTMYTAYEYAEVLGCSVQLVADDDWEIYLHSHEVKSLYEALGAENEALQKRLADMAEQVAELRTSLAEYKHKSDQKSDRIDKLCEAIEKKDAIIERLQRKVEGENDRK